MSKTKTAVAARLVTARSKGEARGKTTLVSNHRRVRVEKLLAWHAHELDDVDTPAVARDPCVDRDTAHGDASDARPRELVSTSRFRRRTTARPTRYTAWHNGYVHDQRGPRAASDHIRPCDGRYASPRDRRGVPDWRAHRRRRRHPARNRRRSSNSPATRARGTDRAPTHQRVRQATPQSGSRQPRVSPLRDRSKDSRHGPRPSDHRRRRTRRRLDGGGVGDATRSSRHRRGAAVALRTNVPERKTGPGDHDGIGRLQTQVRNSEPTDGRLAVSAGIRHSAVGSPRRLRSPPTNASGPRDLSNRAVATETKGSVFARIAPAQPPDSRDRAARTMGGGERGRRGLPNAEC